MNFPRVTPVTGRIIILLLGIIILGVGLHSYFQSDWVKYQGYKVCDGYYGGRPCPGISMERYFVAMIIICFCLSICEFISGLLFNKLLSDYKLLDIGFHIVSAVLLLIAAIVFMISASQVQNLWDAGTRKHLSLRTPGKIIAGLLTIVQSLLYAVVGYLIFREK